MHRYAATVWLSSFLLLSVVFADQTQDTARIQEALKGVVSGSETSAVVPTPIPGIYEVMVGANVVYFSADGQYMLVGDLIDTKAHKNLSVPRRNEARLHAINTISESDMFIFAPEKQAKHTITVFTDLDCGYCRKLHKDIKGYNDSGIRVRYLLFPRAGKDSKSYEKAVDAWCASDRNAAFTRAKNGEELERKECPNPILRHMALGEQIGITGTPTIITDTGEMIPGYLPPDKLANHLDGDHPEESK